MLWQTWTNAIQSLRPAFSRNQTFLWFTTILIAFTIREDMNGVTSFVRCLDFLPNTYPLILNFFHSSGIQLSQLRSLWTQQCLKLFADSLVKFNGRVVLIADGIKNPKEGRKMPGIKNLHQESTNNSKPEYVMAHSCQAICLLAKGTLTFFAVPLACAIHEGTVTSNRDTKTLHDKLMSLLEELQISVPYYFVADAFYANRKIISSLVKNGQHLISRVRSNAVAYRPCSTNQKKRGRPKLYGDKITLISVFGWTTEFTTIKSPFNGEADTLLKIFSLDLLWKPVGRVLRFVWVIHPNKGRWILCASDLTLLPAQIVELYGLRFRIELAFKQAIYQVGAFGYHLWMKTMDRIKRCSTDQYLHRKSEEYRNAVVRKLKAYEIYIQCGLITLGLLQYLAIKQPMKIYSQFGSWFRTINTSKTPSETIVAKALQNTYSDFRQTLPKQHILKKFLKEKLNFHQKKKKILVA